MTVYTYTIKMRAAGLATLTTSGILKADDEYRAICSAVREAREPFEKAGIVPTKLTVEIVAHPAIEVS